MNQVKEGLASLKVESAEIPSKKMPVFYNQVMERNRHLSVLLLKAIGRKGLRIADPLAASGIRSIRMLLETEDGMIEHISINDGSEEAVRQIKANLEMNKVTPDKVTVTCMDANEFLLQSKGFDYIDIDPFGSPNPFLDTAVKRIARDGILAVTATDTAPLCGTYPKPCRRNYWAEPLRNSVMHETALRILIRKVQLIGMQHDKALNPILSYSDEHYLRVFFLCSKSKAKCDEIYSAHRFFHYCPECLGMKVSANNKEECCRPMQAAGPLWAGKLWDRGLLSSMLENGNSANNRKFIRILHEEAVIDSVGFHELSVFVSKHGLGMVPSQDKVISALRKAGFQAAKSHFRGIRTDADIKSIIDAIKNLNAQSQERGHQ